MTKEEILKTAHFSWLETEGTDTDVVLTSRIRLARNLKDIPFPGRAEFSRLAAVREQVEQVMPAIVREMDENFEGIHLEELSPLERNVLADKRLVSGALVKNPQHREAIISEDTRAVLMVNEDDHLRIQCQAAGFDLDTPMAAASRIDDIIESQLDIAFDEKMGYLTACPTNLGTGLRATVFLHLPGLVFTKNIQSIAGIAPQLGLAVRSMFSDGKETSGCLYEISNQLTLGFSEKELLDNLKNAVAEIVAHERKARKALALYMKDQLEDKVWRAYGTLRYARLLNEKETLELLSWVRLGLDLRLLGEVDANCFGDILIASRTSCIQNLADSENLSKNEIDRLRAEQVRKTLLAYGPQKG